MGLLHKLSMLTAIIMLIIMACGCVCNVAPHEANIKPQPSMPDHGTGQGINTTGNVTQDTPTPTLALTPAPRPSAFTISVEGGKDHRQGETLRLHGLDTYSDAVYLFVTGTSAPVRGGRLDDIGMPVVDLNPATFTRVNVSDDGTWNYWWTPPNNPSALLFDLYNVIAVAGPRDSPHLDEATKWDMVAVKIEPGLAMPGA